MFLGQLANYVICLFMNIFMSVFMKNEMEQIKARPDSPYAGILLITTLLVCMGLTILIEAKFRSCLRAKYVYAVIGVIWNIVGLNAAGFTVSYAACFIIMTMIIVYVDFKLTLAVNGVLGSYLIFQAFKELVTGSSTFVPIGMPLLIIIIIMITTCLTSKLFIVIVNEQVEDIHSHNETQKVLITTVATATEQVFQRYDTVMKGLDEITEQVEKNRLSMHNIAHDMEATATDIQKQVYSTNEIHTKIQEAEISAEKIETAVNDVSLVITDGLKNAESLATQAKIVDNKTQEMSAIITQLSNRVKDVSGIVETILSISEETNLLALNASIEAARAGEAGKGFAVVAGQIRLLAENTKVATTKITDIITELEGTTDSTHHILGESIINIHANSEKAIEVNKNFTDTGVSMSFFKSLVDDITRDIKQIYESNEAIVESVTQLSDVSDGVTSSAHTGLEGNDSIINRMDWLNMNMKEIFTEITNLKELITNKE